MKKRLFYGDIFHETRSPMPNLDYRQGFRLALILILRQIPPIWGKLAFNWKDSLRILT